MPFKSEKQRRYLWKNRPSIAKKFAKDSKKKKKVVKKRPAKRMKKY